MEQDTITSAEKALSNSLIFSAIAPYLCKPDLLSLSLTSRTSFDILLPILWTTLWNSIRVSSRNEATRLLNILEPTFKDPKSSYANYPLLVHEIILTLEPGVTIQTNQLFRLSKCLPNLQILSTRDRFIDGQVLLSFASNCPRLHTISLRPKVQDNRYLLTTDISQVFVKTPNLEVFEGRFVPLNNLGMRSLFRHCPRLHTLLVATSLLNRDAREELVHHGTGLRNLTIAFPAHATDEDILALGKLNQLHSLTLITTRNLRIASETLANMLALQRNLTRLVMRDTPTSDAVLDVLAQLPHLAELTLENHADMEYFGDHPPQRADTHISPTSAGFIRFAATAGIRIMNLYLVHQPGLDEASFAAITRCCSNLKCLGVTISEGRLVNSVVEFARECHLRIEVGIRGEANVLEVWKDLHESEGWSVEVQKSSWLAPLVVYTREARI